MTTVLWAALAVVAWLWPFAVSGPLDGAPLDEPLEAIVIGVIVPLLIATAPWLLRRRDVRGLIVALLACKAIGAIAFVPDGWCLRFTSPVPVFVDDVRVPHAWDVRADWLSDVPTCSAIMTTNYPELERFPAWFYNLPPANFRDPVRDGDRPPGATSQLDLSGFLRTSRARTFSVIAGEDISMSGVIDGRSVSGGDLVSGIALAPGIHDVRLHGALQRTHWSLDLRLDGASMWRSAVATLAPSRPVDVWLRPLVRYLPAVFTGLLLWIAAAQLLRVAPAAAAVGGLSAALCAGVTAMGGDNAARVLAVALAVPAAFGAWRRQRSSLAHALLIVLPFLAIAMALAWPRAGIFTWFSSGDDWWLFQRFSYRIYLQHFWLEGGERAFYYQPLYRWIAGALHLVFGDSSIGELLWDASAAAIGATFAFQFVKAACNARWAWAASVLTLCVFALAPTWYFFGRGLSELSSAGFVYGAALAAMRARVGSRWWLAAAGLLVALTFYTRLNNGPMAIAVCLFALPLRVPAADAWSPLAVWRRASKRVVAGVLTAFAIAVHLFLLRAWYYTGVYDMFYGSSTRINTMWKQGESLLQSLTSSVLMLLTMHDPPAFDVRALPLLLPALASVLALLRAPVASRLPLTGVGFFLAGMSTAFFFRGVGYPGRFTVHLVPIGAALTVCLAYHLLHRPRRAS